MLMEETAVKRKNIKNANISPLKKSHDKLEKRKTAILSKANDKQQKNKSNALKEDAAVVLLASADGAEEIVELNQIVNTVSASVNGMGRSAVNATKKTAGITAAMKKNPDRNTGRLYDSKRINGKNKIDSVNRIWSSKIESFEERGKEINPVVKRSAAGYSNPHRRHGGESGRPLTDDSFIKSKTVSNKNIKGNERQRSEKTKDSRKITLRQKLSMLISNKAAVSTVHNENASRDAVENLAYRIKRKASVRILTILLGGLCSFFIFILLPFVTIIMLASLVPPISWLMVSDSGQYISFEERMHELNIAINNELNDGAYITGSIDNSILNEEIAKLYYAKTGSVLGSTDVDAGILSEIAGLMYDYNITLLEMPPEDGDYMADYSVSTIHGYDSGYAYSKYSCVEHAMDEFNTYFVPEDLSEYNNYKCYNALPVEVDERSVLRIGDYIYIQAPNGKMYTCIIIGKRAFNDNNHIGLCSYNGYVLSTMYHGSNSILFDYESDFGLSFVPVDGDYGYFESEEKLKVYCCVPDEGTALRLVPYGSLGNIYFNTYKENGYNEDLLIIRKEVNVFNYNSLYIKTLLTGDELSRYEEMEKDIKEHGSYFSKYLNDVFGAFDKNVKDICYSLEGSREYVSSAEFVSYVYSTVAMYLPDNAAMMLEYCSNSGYKFEINGKFKVGDIVFTKNSLSNMASDAAIYIGSGNVAYVKNGEVVIEPRELTDRYEYARIFG